MKISSTNMILTLCVLCAVLSLCAPPVWATPRENTKDTAYMSIAQRDGTEAGLKFGIPAMIITALLFLISAGLIIHHGKKNVLAKILIQEIMTARPTTIKEDDTLGKLATLFEQLPIRHFPVINDFHEMVGIITRKDFREVSKPRKTVDGEYIYDTIKLDLINIQQAMKKTVVYLYPYSTLYDALVIMKTHAIGCIPIIDESRHIVGIITQTDILKALNDILAKEPVPEIETILSEEQRA